MVSEYKQLEMAQCHIAILKQLLQKHVHHIIEGGFEKNYNSSCMATRLIKNFG